MPAEREQALLASQPHQFDVALGFPLKTTARLNAVEVTVDGRCCT